MITEEILQSLCYYDKRNPDCTLDEDELEGHNEMVIRNNQRKRTNTKCVCDNCFYGRTKLAEELLKVIATTNVVLSDNEKELIYQKERKKYEGSSWEVELDYHKETFMSGIDALIEYLDNR